MISVVSTAACAIVLLLALAGWFWRLRRYRWGFRISAHRDDCLACRDDPPSFQTTLDSSGFELPAGVVKRGRTALLSLDIESTLRGRIVDPFVEVRRGSVVFRQYFEQGARGRRFLNVSPVCQDGEGAGLRVDLRGSAIRWKRDATVMVFDAPPVDGERILVIAPHPDDAEIAGFGVYAGRGSWVATITAGEKGTSDLSAICSRREATRWNAHLRVWDSLSIPQLGRASQERCVNLVYPDGKLREMHARPSERFEIACEEALARAELRSWNATPDFRVGGRACTWDGLVEELRRLVERAAPSVILCPHPILDAHPDHVFATVALDQAVREHRAKDVRFLLYVVHAPDAPVYPFGPRDAVVSLPPWTDAEWLAESVYSHPLPIDIQRAKYFAVGTAHDERTFAGDEPRTLWAALTTVKREVSALLGGTGLRPTSFLRRAPRPNEFFFVVSAEGLSQVVRRALQRYAARG
jgi:LmbE family N-acetylglucosaminyl deacetylase